jgi:hypothetical protein
MNFRGKKQLATLDDIIEDSGSESQDQLSAYLGFPPYFQPNLEAPYIVEIQLETDKDVEEYVKLTGYDTLLDEGKRSVKSVWYPALEKGERGSNAQYIWVEEDDDNVV